MEKKDQSFKYMEVSIHETDIGVKLKGFIDGMEEMAGLRLPQKAYHIMRMAIRELLLPPGSAVLERELAEVLEMSRTPVREALVRLETDGMVKIIPRRGFIVEPIVREDLEEIYEIAESLDGLAAEKATGTVTECDLKQLDLLVREQEQAIEGDDLMKWAKLDDEFHSLIIKLAQHQRLNVVVDIHSDHLYRARLFTIHNRPAPERSILEHKAIIACMRARDGAAARKVMQSHRERARKEIIGVMSTIDQ